VFLNNRYYNPTLGVFLSVDPLVSATGDPYLYAGGNPTTLSDPNGLWPCISCAWDGATDAVSGAVGAVVDAGASVVSGAYNRTSTLVTYEFDATVRRASNPLQSTWDFFSGTTEIEQFSALETIVFDDARLYKNGRYCGQEAECFTGSDAFGGAADATTTGHTIRISGTKSPSKTLVAHEMQHVYDIESVGGVGFYASYGAFSVACGCYRDNPWEKRAYSITNNYPQEKPSGLFGQWTSSMWSWLTGGGASLVGPTVGAGSSSPPGFTRSRLRPY
jgi:hypothetical protein